MKKLKKILLVCLIIVVAMSIKVKAEESTVLENDVLLEVSSTEAKIGDKIQINIVAKSATGVGGLNSILTWDKTKLKFVNETSFPLSGADGVSGEFYFSVLYDGDENEADLGTLEFEVLDTVEVGETLNIGISNIEIVDLDFNGIIINDKQASIKIIAAEGSEEGEGEGENESDVNTNTLTEIKITKAPTKTTYKVGEKFDKEGMIVTASYSDGTTKEISSYTYSPVAELTAEDKEIVITYIEGEVEKTVTQKITVEEAKEETKEPSEEEPATKEPVKEDPAKKDPTIANKDINAAGSEGQIIMLIISALLIAIVLYVKYRKYSDVK